MEWVGIGILGLIIGSFLTTVIYRQPLMLHHEWRQQCQEYLRLPQSTIPSPSVNLCYPDSHCPRCQHCLRWWHTIPLVSWILLKGRCTYCHTPIHWRYPTVELVTCLMTLGVFWHIGPEWMVIPALLFTWGLIVLLFIDLEHHLLPDSITLPLLWLGLVLNSFYIQTTPSAAILGAAGGYGILWSISMLYYRMTHRQGMGHGDFKLLAALGAWFGWQALPGLLLIAAGAGSLIGMLWLILGRKNWSTPIPFGPFLALAGWVYWIGENHLPLLFVPSIH